MDSTLTADEQNFANQMRTSWVSYVKTGAPVIGSNGAAWPKYTFTEGAKPTTSTSSTTTRWSNALCGVFPHPTAPPPSPPWPVLARPGQATASTTKSMMLREGSFWKHSFWPVHCLQQFLALSSKYPNFTGAAWELLYRVHSGAGFDYYSPSSWVPHR